MTGHLETDRREDGLLFQGADRLTSQAFVCSLLNTCEHHYIPGYVLGVSGPYVCLSGKNLLLDPRPVTGAKKKK